MTIFAGIVSMDARTPGIPSAAVKALAENLSRKSGVTPIVHSGPSYELVFCDFNIFDGGALRTTSSGAISLLAGDPLVESLAPSRGRAFDELHGDWSAGTSTTLRQTRGTFCGAHIDPGDGRLWLIADKLGLRPIYYATVGGFVIFASSLRVLEECPLVPRHGDLQGLAETACFGYPLGARTYLESVRVLESGQIVEFTERGARKLRYWRWDNIATGDAAVDEICDKIQTAFISAVRLRLGSNQFAVSLLSSGLDSRCVAACLSGFGADVETIGFGPEGSADQVVARQVADAIGARHFEMSRGIAEFWPRLATAHNSWIQGPGQAWPVQQARSLWSGEGGDRVLAPVNLYEGVITAMRGGDADGAISRYMEAEHSRLPRRLFRNRIRSTIRQLPRTGLRAELDDQLHPDAARRFHLYVLVNEARRNIKQYFEDLDLTRIELIMPFYDAEIVRVVLSYPLDHFVRHRLYHRWLKYLPESLHLVPWQAYPGAEPCPLPLPPSVRTQWDEWYTEEEEEEHWRTKLELADATMRRANFPSWLLRRLVLRMARRLMRIGYRSYAYLFDVARPFVLHPPIRRPSPKSRARQALD